MKLYFAPNTRAVRVAWLLEELGVTYDLEPVEFKPTSDRFFQQDTPTGKLPTLDDDGCVLAESGAIVEYLLERHDDGRFAPRPGEPDRGAFLQWLHFAESTAFPPLGVVVWLTRYRTDTDQHANLIADARARAERTFEWVDIALADRHYVLGDRFSAADVMLGFTVMAGQMLGVVDERFPALVEYAARLQSRPALQKVLAY